MDQMRCADIDERPAIRTSMQIIGSAERICPMESLYQHDLAHVQARAFGKLAQGAAAKIVRRLRSSSARIRRVMDVGCGSGFLIKALADAGFEVTGINISAELLELARANAPKAHFIHACAYDVQIRGYDAVVALAEPLTYHTEGAEADTLLSNFFQRVAEAVPAGGIMFIFDVIGLGEPCLAGRTWMSGDDWAVLVETTEDQSERTLVRKI
jgi:SAM-dependent methyltransferase